ncbi:allantoate amidohydrolase [Spongiactinospora sp. TRM90649]|uniref:allantoate amidohydrolase n=1 Tax=Spongiactinospora sp. TRM90649 TaxID=3031114 RepID=UPI0023F7E91F|nr:allantoate amidohydrolase [Spongiactinospora sp. TRM90649]MDF5752676.1 allantoate amidohydrolase [Spongiactinospora sp. TRM90649]
MGFDGMWSALTGVGTDPGGGYTREAWSGADLELREWFRQEAERRGLDLRGDRNGNLWAWWGDPDTRPGVVAGSHLDSVRQGGAYDGPLGVVSAFAAIDLLRERGVTPGVPVGVACFTEEEGARFGVPCLGSRLLTGVLEPDRARGLTDDDGDTLAEVLKRAGRDPAALGRDPETLGHIGAFVELHVEQGRALDGLGSAIGVAASIWPHGRWRLDFRGRADHAGTSRLADREDPMLPFANAVLAARTAAERAGVVATVGKVRVSPGSANAVPGHVAAWLDVRGEDERAVRDLVAEVGAGVEVACESWTPEVLFDPAIAARLSAALGDAPVIPTAAGHDAGILASAGAPTAMVFVRNPTGISHSPEEYAEPADCHAGVVALADAVKELADGLLV